MRSDGSVELFRLPLWKLLDLRHLNDRELHKLCSDYLSGITQDGVWRSPYDFLDYENGRPTHQVSLKEAELPPRWAVPEFGIGVTRFTVMPVKPWSDSDQLYQRGDIFGFIGIIATLRHAVNKNDNALANHHCANAHRALVSVGRVPTFRPYWKRLAIAVNRLQRFLGVDETAPSLSNIQRQINTAQYLPSHRIVTRFPVSPSESDRMVSHCSMVVSAKKHQVVREAGRAGHFSRHPQLWALRPIDRPAGLP